MAGKRKKVLLGMDFREESVTRKGKPRKKKPDDAENTQQLEVKEKKEEPAKEASGEKAKEEAPKESKPPKKSTEKSRDELIKEFNEEDDDDMLLTKEQARVGSVITFAFGIFILMATWVPGSEGWRVIHNLILGIFGFVSVLVAPMVLWASRIISKGRMECASKIFFMILWLIILCSSVEIIFVGRVPHDGFAAYLDMVYKDGSEFIGGGVVGSPISYFLLKYMGRAGSVIVSLLMIFVIGLISSGKDLDDFFKMLIHPFFSFGKLLERVMCYINGEELDDEEFDDEDEDEPDSEAGAYPEMPQNNGGRRFYRELKPLPPRDVFDAIEQDAMMQERMPYPEPPPVQNAPVYDNAPRWEFDIPLPEENYTIHNAEPAAPIGGTIFDIPEFVGDIPEKEPETEPEKKGSELDSIIAKAVEKKERQDKLAAGEAVEEEKTGAQMPLYILPGLDLLTLPNNKNNSSEAVAEMNEKATKIVDTFKSFGVEVAIRDIYRGPSITRYEIQPGVGVKVSKIRGLEDDIALSLAAQGVRLEAPVPGKAAVGIEVPNTNKDTVTLREILSSSEFRNAESKLAFAVGKDITGNAIVGDITKMPHIIIAGTTGSGKSVCTRSMIMSILYKAKPDEVKIVLIDPKVVEFKIFEGCPHLLIPIVTEAKKAAGALNWAVNEMMRRYNTFADIGANDLKSYNEIAEEEDDIPFMPQIVIFIDELADMMLVAGKEVEDSICRLAQMGRAAGMHLVVATQRPTTDVITGLIKANIPSRIALSVKSQIDSRTILDMAGADKLLGNGDMLYMPIGTSKPVRIQGCFASAKDINETLEFIRSQATGEYDTRILEAVENFIPQAKGDHGGGESSFEAGSDEEYVFKGAEVAVMNGQISTTLLQRKLKLGYARASRIMDELEERGIIGPSEGSKPRKVLMSQMQFDDWKMRMAESRDQ